MAEQDAMLTNRLTLLATYSQQDGILKGFAMDLPLAFGKPLTGQGRPEKAAGANHVVEMA